MKLTRIQRYLLSILSGILMVLAFPYTGSLTPLAFVAWIPLLMVEDTIDTQRYRWGKMLLHGYITFLIYNVGVVWWVWNADEGGALMAFILNALLMSLAFLTFHIVKRRTGKKIGYWALFAVWLGFEFAHFHWELSWPWMTLGNVFSITPSWVQWYEFTGVIGGSWWILAVNVLLFKLLRDRFTQQDSKSTFSARKLALPLIVLLLPLSLSLWMYAMHDEEGVGAEVVLVQPNIDPYYKFTTIGPAEQLHRICDIAEQIKTPNTKIVLAPETAIPVSFDEAVIKYDVGYEILKERMKDWGSTQLFIGASTEKRFSSKISRAAKKDRLGGDDFVEYYNSSLLMGNKIAPQIVHKSKLVLGAEKVPFSHWFPFLEEMSLDFGGTSGTLGVENKPKNMKGVFLFTPSICYESIYGDFTAQQTALGSKAIFIITNDGWWGNTPGYKQHFSFARLRAIENRKSVARSANTGTSGFINQRGDVVQSSSWWKQAGLKDTILLNDRQTVYMKTGDLIGKLALFIALALIVFSLFKNYRSEGRKQV